MVQNTTPPPDETQNVNSVLDAIIAENNPEGYQYQAQGTKRTLPLQGFIRGLAHNPKLAALTLVPVVLVGSVVFAATQSSPNGQKIADQNPSGILQGQDDSSDRSNSTLKVSNGGISSTNGDPQTTTTPETGPSTGTPSGNQPLRVAPAGPTPTITTPSPGGSSTPATPPPAIISSFGIASWNTLYSNTASNVGSGAKELAGKGADIIGFQEAYRPAARKNIRDKLLTCSGCTYTGYINYSDDGPTPGALAIIWNKSKFTGLDSGYVKTNEPYGSPDEERYISAKWITWAKLRDNATNRQFYILNTHTVYSVESGGNPTGTASRLANHKRHMDKLDVLIDNFQAKGLPVFITGDFNVNYRNDAKVRYKDFPYARMNKQGIQSGWQQLGAPSGGTNSDQTRLIDYVANSMNSGITPLSISIYSKKLGSDHNPVIMKFQLKK